MNNRWTGGQYSLFRMIFGAYLFIHFLQLIPWASEIFSSRGALPNASNSPLIRLFPNILAIADAPWIVIAFILSAMVATIFYIAGLGDKIGALWMWYVLTCLFGRNPLTANPSLPFVGWILLAHLFIPSSPYGSLSARGRVDPSGDWFMPKGIFTSAWVIMSLAYTYSGYTKLMSPSWVNGTAFFDVLENPLARPWIVRDFILSLPPIFLKVMTWLSLGLELLFAPLALFRVLRPYLWLVLLGMHCGLCTLIDFADLSLGMVVLHLFTIDPGWIRPMKKGASDIVFYDGNCGLCHRFIRFLLAEDKDMAFRFAPLQSKTFETALSKSQRQDLPDSIVVFTEDRQVLIFSSAIIYALKRLGGFWRILGIILGLIPPLLRDFGYRVIAKIRYRIYGQTKTACPMMPNHLRVRFILES